MNGSTSCHAWPPGVASMAWCTKHASHPTAYNTHRSVSGHHGAWGQVPKQSVCGAWCAQLTVEPHGAKCKKHPPAPQRPWGTTGHHCKLACTALRTRWTCELPLTPPLVNVRWAGNDVCGERDGWGGHHGMTICVQTPFAKKCFVCFCRGSSIVKIPITPRNTHARLPKHAPRASVQRTQFSILGTQTRYWHTPHLMISARGVTVVANYMANDFVSRERVLALLRLCDLRATALLRKPGIYKRTYPRRALRADCDFLQEIVTRRGN